MHSIVHRSISKCEPKKTINNSYVDADLSCRQLLIVRDGSKDRRPGQIWFLIYAYTFSAHEIIIIHATLVYILPIYAVRYIYIYILFGRESSVHTVVPVGNTIVNDEACWRPDSVAVSWYVPLLESHACCTGHNQSMATCSLHRPQLQEKRAARTRQYRRLCHVVSSAHFHQSYLLLCKAKLSRLQILTKFSCVCVCVRANFEKLNVILSRYKIECQH